MPRPRIHVTAPVPVEVDEALRRDFQTSDSPERVEGIVAMLTTRVDGAYLDRVGPQLKVVANYAVGVNNVDLAAAAERNVVVANTPDVLTRATAELAVGLMLAQLRRIAEGDRFVRRRDQWLFSLEFMNVTLTVEVGDEERVLLVPKHEGEYAPVGTVARVTDRVKLPGGATAVAVEGLFRGVAGAAETDPQGRLFVEVEDRPDDVRTDERTRELETEYRAVVEEILELRGDDGRVQAFVRSIADPGALADTSGYSPDLSFEQKLQLLETIDVLPVPGGPIRVRIAPARLSGSMPRSFRSFATEMYSTMRFLTSSSPAWSESSTSRVRSGSSTSSERLPHGTASSQSR